MHFEYHDILMLDKRPINWRQHPDMTIVVDCDVNLQLKQTNKQIYECYSDYYLVFYWFGLYRDVSKWFNIKIARNYIFSAMSYLAKENGPRLGIFAFCK